MKEIIISYHGCAHHYTGGEAAYDVHLEDYSPADFPSDRQLVSAAKRLLGAQRARIRDRIR